MNDENIYIFKQLLTEELETLLGKADIVVHSLIRKQLRTAAGSIGSCIF